MCRKIAKRGARRKVEIAPITFCSNGFCSPVGPHQTPTRNLTLCAAENAIWSALVSTGLNAITGALQTAFLELAQQFLRVPLKSDLEWKPGGIERAERSARLVL